MRGTRSLALVFFALLGTGCSGELRLQLQADASVDDVASSGDDGPAPLRCRKQMDCPSSSDTSHCDVDGGVCVECLVNSDCPGGSLSHCNTATHECFSCTADAGCHGSKVCNIYIPRCATVCSDGTACRSGAFSTLCSLPDGYCVECIDPVDCTNHPNGTHCYGRPTTPAGVCGCTTQSDCKNGGTCGPPTGLGGAIRYCQ